MTRKVEVGLGELKQEIALPNDNRVILLETLGKKDLVEEELARNVFMQDQQGRTLWRVSSKFDSNGGPFIQLYHRNDTLEAYRWDGGLYEIDIATGFASPKEFLK